MPSVPALTFGTLEKEGRRSPADGSAAAAAIASFGAWRAKDLYILMKSCVVWRRSEKFGSLSKLKISPVESARVHTYVYL